MIIVHHLGHSQSQRVVWLCEELGIDYELKKYDRDPLLAPASYKALHPIEAAPVIEDGQFVKIAESGACLEYINQVYGNAKFAISPDQGREKYSEYLYWFHFANGTLQPAIASWISLVWAGLPQDNAMIKLMSGRLEQCMAFLNDRLGRATWLAGDEFTLADVMVVFSVSGMREFTGQDISKYENVLSYLHRVADRPGFQRASQKGDPDIDVQAIMAGPAPPPFAALSQMKS